MKVGIFYVGGDQNEKVNEIHHFLGGRAARVVKRTMPGVEVVHLTDTRAQGLDGVDSVCRIHRAVPMAVFRMQHHQAPGEWLFIDSDVLVIKDVQDVFAEPFDIAICDRVTGDGAHGAAFAEMPHNMGVVFSRSPSFWKAVEKELMSYEAKLQEWMGDQLAVCRLIKRGGFDVKVLPGAEYNFPPRSPDMPKASIVHYKGKRKPWLVEHSAALVESDAA